MAQVRVILGLDKELDGLPPGNEIALTFAEAKFNSLVSRGGTFSNKIGFRKTANNKLQLSFLDESRETSDKPYQLHSARIIVDSIVVFNGFATIQESQDNYDLRFFSGVSNFFQVVGDKSITELDLSAYDHAWTAAEVNNNRQNNQNAGYVYPNINYGRWTDQAVGDRPHTDFFPAVYFKTLLEKAATESGYTLLNYTSKRAIPFSLPNFENRSQLDTELSAPAGEPQTISIPNEPINMGVVTNIGGLVGTAIGQNVIVLSEGSTLEINALCSIDNTTGVNLNLVFGRAGNQRLKSVVVNAGASGSLFFEGTISTPGNYGFYLDSDTATQATIDIGILGAFIQVTGGVNKIMDGNKISIKDTLPDISIKNLFLFEAVKTNSLIISDPISKTIEFIPFNTIAAKKLTAEDWSQKVDLTTKAKYEYRLEEYAQNNYLNWEEGIEEDPAYNANNNLGRGNFTVSDLNLALQKQLYKAPFAASGKSQAFSDGIEIIAIPRYSNPALDYFEADLDPKPRVVTLNLNGDVTVSITGQPVLANQANATFEGFDISITEDYTALAAMFDKMKLVEVYVRLSIADIEKFDITKPVFLLDNYWFIRELQQYRVTGSQPIKVKLIRL